MYLIILLTVTKTNSDLDKVCDSIEDRHFGLLITDKFKRWDEQS